MGWRSCIRDTGRQSAALPSAAGQTRRLSLPLVGDAPDRAAGVVGDGGFPRKADVTLENLKSAAAELDVGAVAVEGLISLWGSRLLWEWPATVVPGTRRPNWS